MLSPRQPPKLKVITSGDTFYDVDILDSGRSEFPEATAESLNSLIAEHPDEIIFLIRHLLDSARVMELDKFLAGLPQRAQEIAARFRGTQAVAEKPSGVSEASIPSSGCIWDDDRPFWIDAG